MPQTEGPATGVSTGVSVLVDMANVMGSRPDGWWRDRAGAAGRLLVELAPLVGARVSGPDDAPVTVVEVVAVLEGRARSAEPPVGASGVRVVRADADGDTTVVAVAGELLAGGALPVVVTADRGLRARIPAGCVSVGPRWLWGATGGGG